MVGNSAPWSTMVTSDNLLLFVPDRLCTLMPLNTHLLVERMYRVENTGVCPGAVDYHVSSVDDLAFVIADADVAVIAVISIIESPGWTGGSPSWSAT